MDSGAIAATAISERFGRPVSSEGTGAHVAPESWLAYKPAHSFAAYTFVALAQATSSKFAVDPGFPGIAGSGATRDQLSPKSKLRWMPSNAMARTIPASNGLGAITV